VQGRAERGRQDLKVEVSTLVGILVIAARSTCDKYNYSWDLTYPKR